MTPAAILPPVLLVLLIPVAFATGVNNTVGKFATGDNEAGGKLPAESKTQAANLQPVLMAPVANNGSNIRLLRKLEGKNVSIC